MEETMTQELTRETVRPDMIDLSGDLMDSPFQDHDLEIVAANIVKLSRENNNTWITFTWEEYQGLCTHTPGYKEKEVIAKFVAMGVLALENGVYSVQDLFLSYLGKFVPSP
jgi:hypothetical protein